MPSAEKIKAFSYQYGVGLIEAKRILIREEIMEDISYIRNNGSLEEKINWLLDQYAKDLKNAT